jgi:hypothetical protein
MRRGTATARVIGQRVTALMLLVLSVLLPVTSLFAAPGSSTERSHACCRRKGASCCPKFSVSSGRFWNAPPSCGTHCAQSAGKPSSMVAATAPSEAAAPFPAPAESTATLYLADAASACPAWQYQRPPPLVQRNPF